jgi:cell division protein ZapD
MPGKVGQHLRDNEWLMAIKQRSAIPGGVCEFDLPAYHYWLHQDAGARRNDLAAWIEPFEPIRAGGAIVLRLLRENGRASRHHRLPRRVPADDDHHQGRAAAASHAGKGPAVRAGDQREQVRAQHPLHRRHADGPRRGLSGDVEFELMFCNL